MVGILETKYSSKVRRKVMSGLSGRKHLRFSSKKDDRFFPLV